MKTNSRIHILSDEVVSKIAAGEVIERPASVLKEILENSIDSGAKIIRIEIEKAGKKLIRVSDDGKGMTREDLLLSVKRHATSKITSFEDLDTLKTFGFRGEALYSVSAVSRMTITSCAGSENSGWQIQLEGTQLKKESQSAPVPGTTVEIRDLFFNTPARAKFLRSDPSERAHLLKTVEECALANLTVAFHVRVDGADTYSLPAQKSFDDASVLNRAREILGKNSSDKIICARNDNSGLRAFISSPENMVASRGLQFFFVNRRPVASRVMQQALYRGYEGFRPKEKHPACVVYMDIAPADFDVNIHPQKRDIKFKSDSEIFKVINSTVAAALLENKMPVNIVSADAVPVEREEILPFVQADTRQPASAAVFSSQDMYVAESRETFQPARLNVSWWTPPYIYLGQFDASYLLFESPSGMVIIDQHAAQEKVIFEQYLSQLNDSSLAVQRLMLPVAVELSASETEHILNWKDWLNSVGFELEHFGPGIIHINAVPGLFDFGEDKLVEFVKKLSDVLGDPNKGSEEVRRETIAMLACKRAVKAHDRLGKEEAEKLLQAMRNCKDGLSCPHGRPTMMILSREEIARRFQRSKPA